MNNLTEVDKPTLHIIDCLKRQVELNPDKTAYIYLIDGEDNEESLTFRELYNASKNIAAKLTAVNAADERVLMLFPPGLEFIISMYGCLMAGAIAVPAYPPKKNRSVERIKAIVSDSQAKFVLATSGVFSASERSFSDFDDLKNLTWVLFDRNDDIESQPTTRCIKPDDVAFLQYTSGSTGNPKGVMVTHHNLVSELEYMRQAFSVHKETISVSWLPTFHDMGLIEGMMGGVYSGYTAILMPPVAFIQKPSRWLRAFHKYRGTHGGAPNFAFDLMVDNVTDKEREGLDLSCINTIYNGAEPIRRSTFDRFVETYSKYGITHKSLFPAYGMAETTLMISGPGALRGPYYLAVSTSAFELNKIVPIDENDPDAKHLVGIGHAWMDLAIRIVNPDTLLPAKDDEVGEIWLSGSIVTSGYWNKKEITEETFKAVIKGEEDSGKYYLRTGDLGFFYDNELFITGRLKDLIILFGKNYYPQDIEHTAELSHPAIQPSAIAAFSIEQDYSEKLVVVCEIRRTEIRNLDVDAVCTAIIKSISEEFEQQVYAIQLLRTASIPKTSSGKIQRKACKQGFLNKTLDVIGESVMSESTEGFKIGNSSVEAWLILWVNQNLKVPLDKIDITRPISEYGLNSLKAVQLQQDFLRQYKVNIPPYYYFQKITLKELSQKALDKVKEI